VCAKVCAKWLQPSTNRGICTVRHQRLKQVLETVLTRFFKLFDPDADAC